MPTLITTNPEALTPNLIPIQPPVGRAISRASQRQLDQVAGHGQVALATDTTRAYLAASAMGNIAALSGLAQGYAQASPSAAGYCQAILHAYAVGATRGIAEWTAGRVSDCG